MAKKKKRKWQQATHRMSEDHQWTAAPGNKIFVADAGAMQFEIPHDWVIKPGEGGSIRFFDKEDEVAADMRLEVSLFYVPSTVDWSGLPLVQLIEDSALSGSARGYTDRGPFHEWRRATLEAAWLQVDFIDPVEDRLANSRICMARGPAAHALITLDFWPEHVARARKVWDAALSSLKLDGNSRDSLNLDGSHKPRRLSIN